jgi:hypothetical protein
MHSCAAFLDFVERFCDGGTRLDRMVLYEYRQAHKYNCKMEALSEAECVITTQLSAGLHQLSDTQHMQGTFRGTEPNPTDP